MNTTIANFVVEKVRRVTVVRFTIDVLDEENFAEVAEELSSKIIDQRPRQVVVDLVSIRLIDDLGLAMLQSFHDSIEEFGGTTILCRLSPFVTRAMSRSGIDCQLHIRTSLNEAVWTF